MSRSDGSFPSYVKYDLDPNHPKAGWNKGARRCSNCGKDWPNVSVFSPSPCHDVMAGIVKTGVEPSMTWREAVNELLHARFNKYYEKWNEGASDQELYWTATGDPMTDEDVSDGMQKINDLLNGVEQT